MENYFYLIIAILAVGFFSGSEIGFFSANRFRIELKSVQGNASAKLISRLYHDLTSLITMLMIGINIALVWYSISSAEILDSYLNSWFGWSKEGGQLFEILVTETAITTLILLVIGEYIPKALFRSHPEKLLLSFAYLIYFFSIVFKPAAMFIAMLSRVFLNLVGFKEKDVKFAFGRTDLDQFVRDNFQNENEASMDNYVDIDAEVFSNALDFNKQKAKDLMVPRTEIIAVHEKADITEITSKFIETNVSKILVYRENLDEVIGFVHCLELFHNPADLNSCMQPVHIIPETMPANTILSELTQSRKSLALVVDEFGGTAGILTIEDLVEEILGEIEDEHDINEDDLIAKEIESGVWLFSARFEVNELNEQYNLDLPTGDYSTIGGLVIHFAEKIPSSEEFIELEQYRITVVSAGSNRIETVKLEKITGGIDLN
jgi:CBS domain containing-hemolysin-like protein